MKWEKTVKLSFKDIVFRSNEAIKAGTMTRHQQQALILKYCRANYVLEKEPEKDLSGVNYGYKEN